MLYRGTGGGDWLGCAAYLLIVQLSIQLALAIQPIAMRVVIMVTSWVPWQCLTAKSRSPYVGDQTSSTFPFTFPLCHTSLVGHAHIPAMLSTHNISKPKQHELEQCTLCHALCDDRANGVTEGLRPSAAANANLGALVVD